MIQLSKDVVLRKIAAGATSAGTAVSGSDVDTAGYEGVMIFASIATANAGNFLQAVHADTASPTDDVAGSKVVPATDGDVAIIDIHRPLKRYVTGKIVRAGANTATGDMYALLYKGRRRPSTNEVANVQKLVALVSPATGTP